MQTLPATRQKNLTHSPKGKCAPRRSLAEAFASFTNAARALENLYGRLQSEVVRLRHELEQTNRDLAQSLEDNQRIRAYLGRVLEGLPCGVLVFDHGLQLRIANPAARRLLTCGEPTCSSPDSAAAPATLTQLLAELPAEDLNIEQEWTMESPEGTRTLGVTRALLAEGQASNEGSILILRDMTEEKQMAREREIVRRTQALAEMATLLAHEIRNPLGSLELFAGLLADATEDHSDTRQWVEYLQAGLRSLSATVNNVLHFHTQPPAELMPTNLVRLLRETVDFLRPLARQRGMQIDLQASETEISIPADPHRLQQAFFNLALNAFRAMSPGGLLSVRIRRLTEEPDRSLVEFEDQGTGIAPENLEKIFATGFTTRPGSPGIGLAVTQKVVEQHGGKIAVRSEVGRGTTFTLTFPVEGAEG